MARMLSLLVLLCSPISISCDSAQKEEIAGAVVRSAEQLINELAYADSGDVFLIPGNIALNVANIDTLVLPANITIAAIGGGITAIDTSGDVVIRMGSGVRFDGVRFLGSAEIKLHRYE